MSCRGDLAVDTEHKQISENADIAPPVPAPALTVRVQDAMNASLWENSVPVLEELIFDNTTDHDYQQVDITLSCDPAFLMPRTWHLQQVRAQQLYMLPDRDVALNGALLAAQTEASRATITLTARADGQILTETTHDIRILARNEWGGLAGLPDILAAFVLPNDPAVARVLRSASDILREAGQSPSLEGYQGDKARVWAQAQAIWCAVCGLNLTYVNPPASFVESGQRIRLPAQIYDERLATCLDTTVLFAACLEAAGLRPVIVLTQGHAFAGLWLAGQDAVTSVVQDLPGIRNRLKLDDLRVFETTLVTAAQKPGFSVACERGESTLRNISDDDEAFRAVIDIYRARLRRIRPLSTLVSSQAADGEDAVTPDMAEQPVFEAAPVLREEKELERLPDRPADRVQRWCNRLLDMTGRNRLLRLPESDRQLIQIDCPAPEKLEDILADMRVGGTTKPLRFVSSAGFMDAQDPRNQDIHQQRHHEETLRAYALEALNRHELIVQRENDALQNALVELYRQARAAEQEGGSNVLFLTIGAVAWVPQDKTKPYLAPLILVPVSLERVSLKSPLTLRAHSDEPRINATLLEMLRSDYDIRIPQLEPDMLPEDDAGLNVKKILEIFRLHLRHIPGWEIRDHVSLTTLSFSKFLMWKDLLERRDQLAANDVASRLLNGVKEESKTGESGPAVGFEGHDDLDTALAEADLVCPMEADSSQLKAVARAAAGENFVLIGPPGTGKSQTIGNIIANTLAQGRTVLFVAEKRTALEVVRARLVKLGIGEFCLDLFSPKTSKMEVLQQFQAAQAVLEDFQAGDYAQVKQKVDTLRNELNAYVRDLHTPRRNGWTPYRGIGVSLRADQAAVQNIPFSWPNADIHSEQDYDRLVQTVEDLAVLYERIGDIVTSPRLVGMEQTNWSPLWEAGLLDAVSKTLGALTVACTAAERVFEKLSLEPGNLSLQRLSCIEVLCAHLLQSDIAGWGLGENAQDIHDTVQAEKENVARYHALSDDLKTRWKESIKTLPLAELLNEWRALNEKWLLSRSMGHKALRKRLTQHALDLPEDCESDLEKLVEREEIFTRLDAASYKAEIGALWRGTETDFEQITAAFRWGQMVRTCLGGCTDDTATLLSARTSLKNLLTEGRDLLSPGGTIYQALTAYQSAFAALKAVMEELAERSAGVIATLADPDDPHWPELLRVRLEGWQEASREMRDWCSWQQARHQAEQLGLAPLVSAIEQGLVARETIFSVFEANYARWWMMHAISDSEVLKGFVAATHEGCIQRFRELDEKQKELSVKLIRARLAGKIPGEAERRHDPEYKILTHEIAKQKRHLPVRRLAEKMPGALRTLTPCLMMSPQSVAQYLPPHAEPFDLVIFDEASQITTWDAIGAIGRGRQVVVVGDPKQLPPTDFFTAGRGGEDDLFPDEMMDLDSILDECLGAGVPSVSLGWHYRSRHESLIAFSNQTYYGGGLVTFPAPVTTDQAVSFRFVSQGVYEPGRGGSHTNPTEARMVVAEAVRIMRDGTNRSVGVVTFNSEQQKLITELLEAEVRKDPALERFTREGASEPLLVKNLENIQGEERDIILFSLTYGPDAAGKISMNFGPLNRDGGERRLNVAITRAREQLIVFGSLRGDQIATERTSAAGVHDLRRFLLFAERGTKALAGAHEGSVGGYDSVFEVQVATMLRAKGWHIATQIGVSGFRIDLGVVDPDLPGAFLAGIECDGATYHRSATARDRDRLRQAVLENLGWTILRIWSTDWWTNAPREAERIDAVLRKKLEELRSQRAEQAERDQKAADDALLVSGIAEEAPADMCASSETSEPLYASETATTVSLPSDSVIADGASFFQAEYDPVLKHLVIQAVDKAGVIREDILIQHISREHGFARAGREIRERIQRVIPALFERTEDEAGVFIWSPRLPVSSRLPFKNLTMEKPVDPAKVPLAALVDLASLAIATDCSDDEAISRMRGACGMSRMGQATRARLAEALNRARKEVEGI
ncbi:DUF3320 domain-containing protein [Acetobacter thailandicus]|nr:DUF3320 domain-containing protein [Acetobacter thailandicus]